MSNHLGVYKIQQVSVGQNKEPLSPLIQHIPLA